MSEKTFGKKETFPSPKWITGQSDYSRGVESTPNTARHSTESDRKVSSCVLEWPIVSSQGYAKQKKNETQNVTSWHSGRGNRQKARAEAHSAKVCHRRARIIRFVVSFFNLSDLEWRNSWLKDFVSFRCCCSFTLCSIGDDTFQEMFAPCWTPQGVESVSRLEHNSLNPSRGRRGCEI